MVTDVNSKPAAQGTADGEHQGGGESKTGSRRGKRRSRALTVNLAFLGVMFLIAFFGFVVAPHDPNQSLIRSFASPQHGFWLGGDNLGRDVLSRTLHGGIRLAWMAPLASAIAVAVGAAMGVAAAYFGGVADAVLMRAVDVLLAFPALLLVLLFVSMLGPELWLITLLTGVSLAPGVARVIRGSALGIVRREYVLWAMATGCGPIRIITREIIPNLISPLVVEYGIRLMWSIGALASLSFLGYGVQSPKSDWGLMVSENKAGLATQPLGVLAPMVAILLFSLACNFSVESVGRRIART